MGDNSAIEWLHWAGRRAKSWNPTNGCKECSPGCANCYAKNFAARFSKPGERYYGLVERAKTRLPVWTGNGRFEVHVLGKPLTWPGPCTVFVDSMSDLFYEGFSFREIAAVFGIMAATPQHVYIVLTKRDRRMLEWFAWAAKHGDDYDAMRFGPSALLTCAWEACAGDAWGDVEPPEELGSLPSPETFGRVWPLPNVIIGVSVEDRQHGVPRIESLRRAPARVRMISAEPLLENLGELDLRDVGWLVAGIESGPRARSCNVGALLDVRDQCAHAGVPFFAKQWTGVPGVVEVGVGSKVKNGGVIGAPWVAGRQHVEIPEVWS